MILLIIESGTTNRGLSGPFLKIRSSRSSNLWWSGCIPIWKPSLRSRSVKSIYCLI